MYNVEMKLTSNDQELSGTQQVDAETKKEAEKIAKEQALSVLPNAKIKIISTEKA